MNDWEIPDPKTFSIVCFLWPLDCGVRSIPERLNPSEEITENELPENLLKSVSGNLKTEALGTGEIVPLDEMERRYLLSAEKLHPGDRKSLAAKLGISESTLYRKLKEL